MLIFWYMSLYILFVSLVVVIVMLTGVNVISVWNLFLWCNVIGPIIASLPLSQCVSTTFFIYLLLSVPLLSTCLSPCNESLMTLSAEGRTGMKCNSTCLGEDRRVKCLMISGQANRSSWVRRQSQHISEATALHANYKLLDLRTFW